MKGKNFAFVQFSTVESATEARLAINGKRVCVNIYSFFLSFFVFAFFRFFFRYVFLYTYRWYR